MSTLLNLDSLHSLDNTMPLELRDPVDFIRPEAIMKSSVGEFYEQTMQHFIQLSAEIRAEIHPANGPDMINYLADSVLPLGALISETTPDIFPTAVPLLVEAATVPVPSPELIKSLTTPHITFNKFAFNDLLERTKKQHKAAEQIAYRLCAGYAPNKDVPRTTLIRNDSGFYKEYVQANILYPWVMQPMNQLRALLPSVGSDVLDTLMSEYTDNWDTEFFALRSGLDFGYALNFEFVSDFRAYLDFKMHDPVFPVNVQRQCWTPFFGINNVEPYEIYINSDDLRGRIVQAFAKSKQLYIEILKTGFTYEAQYASLMGMAGRFMLSGNLGGIMTAVHKRNVGDYALSARLLTHDISEHLENYLGE